MRSSALSLLLLAAGCGGASAPSPSAPPSPSAVAPSAVGSSTAAPSTAASPTAAPSSSAPAAPPASSAPPAAAGEGCAAGALADCDARFERWSSREILPAGQADAARRDADALRAGCDRHGIGAACMGYALMLKYGTATGARDNDGAKPYFAKLKAARDLNGFRGVPTGAEGVAVRKAAEAECDKGRARSCAQAGWAAYDGVQRDKSHADAYRFYARACELGLGTGCRWAGHFAITYPELGVEAKGAKLLKKGCEALQNPGACDELGLFESTLKGDIRASIERWQAACDDGSRGACFHAGHALLDKGRADDGKKLLRLACDAGEEGACKALSR